MKSTLSRYIGESAMPVTLPLFKGVIIYDDRKPFRRNKGSIPDKPLSYDIIAVTK